MNQGTPFVEHPLEGEGVGNDCRTYAVVFEESFKLQDELIRQRAGSPKLASGHDWKFENCGDVDC